ncbi:hypothetical protein P170DRAFT_476830 [Aspergillus steynii IBT 23096]|uniref:Uncharacterized protein n=1 Tax=Aspergillus steynii IBT 23096 TaxID=1392250 RepID=A0A2I2G5N4_9EURO|nr:uncharacterized protein P170DRAFT_476830 [Aspergillus steynii IBT 23096]PLB48187.1 hypothetical protein P170DRAFT_476830 [Aspergillus steynii IBT 23096]
MSQPIVHRPKTPTLQPNTLQALHPSVLPEYADAPSDSSASTSECPCCAPSPLPDLEALGEAIPECTLDTLGLASTPEGQFQASVSFQPTTEFSTQAVATVPHNKQAKGHCDFLTAVSRKTIRDGLTWLEATVTRGGIPVATATALYDKIHSDTMDDAQVQEASQR